MIDSLQTFFDASEGDGEGEGDAALLVQYLASLAADASLPCAVVVLAQSQSAPCPAAEPATTLAQYMAKLVLEVGPLQSGHSSAVHGQVVMYVLHTHTHACMHADIRAVGALLGRAWAGRARQQRLSDAHFKCS